MQKFILQILLCFFSLASYGQIELKGIVIDFKTKEPLPYVNYTVSSNIGGTTDDSGRFEFSVNAKTDSVVFSYLGYKDEVLKKRFFRKRLDHSAYAPGQLHARGVYGKGKTH